MLQRFCGILQRIWGKQKTMMKPLDIEQLSFSIIDEEAGPHTFNEKEWPVVQRMIHTSADFEYMQSVRFHQKAVDAGIKAICSGKTVFTDTEMARAGIRKASLASYGGKTLCLIRDSEVAEIARKNRTTRSCEAVNLSVEQMDQGIYVIGNAPTALMRLIELIREGAVQPALVVGFPVGFVNAAESKAMLAEVDIPYITNQGRKGGSNIAASVVNALIILAGEQA